MERLEETHLSQFNLKLQHSCVSNNPFYSRRHSYSPFCILLKVTLGVVAWMLQWFGNLVMEMPVGLPVVAQTGGKERGIGEGGQLEPLVIED